MPLPHHRQQSPAAEQVAENVWLLRLGWRAPFGSNAYLVDDDEITLVDCGMPLNATRIRDVFRQLPHEVKDIDRVLITHYDLDHVGGLNRLHPHLDCPVYIGQEDLELMTGDSSPPELNHKGIWHRGTRLVHSLPNLDYRGIKDGDKIGEFTAHHTPGHNPGHFVYTSQRADTAFLGDLVWETDGELTPPIWFDSYDMDLVRASIRKFADSTEEFELAAVAHGDPIRKNGFHRLQELASTLD